MVIFGILGYLFLDSGFSLSTRVKVNYNSNSAVRYNVKYLEEGYENNIDNNKFISNMVDKIDISCQYDNIFSKYINGYYRYNVLGYIIAYENDIENVLWKRKYYLLEDKTVVLDQNDIDTIKIEDNVLIDYKKYKDEINQFIDNYDIDISAYLHVRINILEFLNFNGLENQYDDSKVITMDIPLTDEIFSIDIQNIDTGDSYYEFSNDTQMNIVFIILGIFLLVMCICSIVMVIKQFRIIYYNQSRYTKGLKKILVKYDKYIVKVNKLYVKKKYNLIYVDSFLDLMDVYGEKRELINFKEIKRGSEALFVIICDDSAWIYKFCS